jgi:hypothetical protein
MTRFVFNWPSGAGGDFLLALLYTYYDHDGSFYSNPRLNLWSVQNKYTEGYRTFKYFDQPEKQQEILDNMPDMCTLQTHSIANHDPLRYDDDVQVVNIFFEDIFVEAYCHVLYKMKTVTLPHDDFQGMVNMNGKLPNSKNMHNISYNKLFIDQDPDTINQLFNVYNITDFDINEIQMLLKAYTDKNDRIIRKVFYEDEVDRTGAQYAYMHRRDSIRFCLETPARATIDEQRKIVQGIEYFDRN